MNIEILLKLLGDKKGSDLYITADTTLAMKLSGKLVAIGKKVLLPDDAKAVVLSTMNPEQQAEFKREKELNFAITSETGARFRVSAFYQRNHEAMVVRRIESDIPTLDGLGMPSSLKNFAMEKRGLIAVVGASGRGKSTTLAAMIGHRNAKSRGHIITVEDPIEFVHEHNNCIVSQREVGVDTDSFEVALKNTLRQAPDVILIGEVRSTETMKYALNFAETGHLCLCTLHANNANQALDRIINFFPSDMHQQVLLDLSLNLKAIIAQQLVPKKDGGRIAVTEVLINTPIVSDLIRKGKVAEIKDVMAKSTELGMMTFDRGLFNAYEAGDITLDDAMAYADSPNNVRLMAKLSKDDGVGDAADFSAWLVSDDKD